MMPPIPPPPEPRSCRLFDAAAEMLNSLRTPAHTILVTTQRVSINVFKGLVIAICGTAEDCFSIAKAQALK